MEGVEEKVVEKYIKMFVEKSEAEKKKEELKKVFTAEFGIEPETVTPKVARRAFELDGNLAKIVDDIMDATNKIPASEDEYYLIVFTTRYNEDNEKSHDWTLITDYGLPTLQKTTSQFIYRVLIEIWRYDDC